MSLVFLLAYQTSMVSVEGLAKLVDPSQLTDDFEGSLDYNHEEWMELRVSLEEFMSNAVHLLSRLEDLQVGRGRMGGPMNGGFRGRWIVIWEVLKMNCISTQFLLCVAGASVQEGVSCGCGRISTVDRGAHTAEEKGGSAAVRTV